MSTNISFEDGYKEFTINNDHNKVIRFNPTDVGILTRVDETMNRIGEIEEIIKNGEEMDPAEAIQKAETLIRAQVDYIFNSPVSDTVFGSQSVLSPVGDGFLFEKFIAAVIPEIEREVKKAVKASKSRVEKYVKAVKELPGT